MTLEQGTRSAGPWIGTAMAESPVCLTIPATPRFLRLARLAAAGIASDLGFSLEAIEDLRVGVDEVCAVLIETAADGALLELTYHADGRVLVVTGRCLASSGALPTLHPVARELLEMTVDSYRIDAVGGVRAFELRKASGQD